MNNSFFLKITICALISIQTANSASTVGGNGKNTTTTTSKPSSTNQTSWKCNEFPNVRYEDAKSCPSEGNFTWLLDDEPVCGLYVTCKCQGGRMTSLASSCEEDSEIFIDGQCVANAKPQDVRCPQKECKENEVQKPGDHKAKHNCPKVEIAHHPDDIHSHGQGDDDDDDHDHSSHQSTTTTSTTTTVGVLNPNHSLSSTIFPVFHSIILILLFSMTL